MGLKVLNTKDGDQNDGDIVSIYDILDFLKRAWKTIAFTSSLGITFAFIYIIFAPKQYEAFAQIKMAQIGLTNHANPVGIVVEDPSSLISRMKIPTSFNDEVITACGYQDKSEAALKLSKLLKLSAPKGLLNTVEAKVLAQSPQVAHECMQAVVNQISLQQMQLAKPFIEEAKIKIAQDNERIEAARKIIAKADQSGSALTAAYLAARDEISYFLTDREKMLDLINSAEQRGTKLISPIYVSENPVSPKLIISLSAGFLCGLFVGLIIAFLRRSLGSASRMNKLENGHA